MTLTKREENVLDEIRRYECTGTCHRYVWRFTLEGETVTRYVKALERKGAVRISYYANSHAVVTPNRLAG